MNAQRPPKSERDSPIDARKDDGDETTGRRGFMAALVAGIATATGLVGYGAGQAEASSHSGTIDNFTIANIDTMRFIPRTTDPSAPADGTIWYNENA